MITHMLHGDHRIAPKQTLLPRCLSLAMPYPLFPEILHHAQSPAPGCKCSKDQFMIFGICYLQLHSVNVANVNVISKYRSGIENCCFLSFIFFPSFSLFFFFLLKSQRYNSVLLVFSSLKFSLKIKILYPTLRFTAK